MWSRARDRDPRTLWVLAFALPLPAFFLVNSLWIHVKLNWLAPIYPPLFLGVALWWTESGWTHGRPRRVRAISIAVVAPLLLAMLTPLTAFVPSTHRCSWSGWEEIAIEAESWREKTARTGKGDVFVFTLDHGDTAQLWRHMAMRSAAENDPHPLPPMLAQNVMGAQGLQFDYWCDPASLIGHDAVMVVPHPEAGVRNTNRAVARFHALKPVKRITA